MTEKPSSIRLWLARYKPDRVRCTLRGGELRELPKPSVTRGQWAQLESGILAISPTYIEAWKGETCIASRPFDSDDDDEEAAAVVPATDPMSALVNVMPTLAQLFVEVGDASAMRHMEAYKLAFDSQLQLVKILSDRLGGLERAWHKMMLDRASDQQAGGDGNDAAAMSLIGSIIKDKSNGSVPHKNGASASADPVTDD